VVGVGDSARRRQSDVSVDADAAYASRAGGADDVGVWSSSHRQQPLNSLLITFVKFLLVEDG
jgi:hypothetical protein